LNPVVVELARLFAVFSTARCWAETPVAPMNIPRILIGLPPFTNCFGPGTFLEPPNPGPPLRAAGRKGVGPPKARGQTPFLPAALRFVAGYSGRPPPKCSATPARPRRSTAER